MLLVENLATVGWEPAIRGMRNPLNSWAKCDSTFNGGELVELGDRDRRLMKMLISQGSADHCKFRRMLVIYCDVVAPFYWWKEYDTYKVGTVANSCSTMHTLTNKPFTLDMFSFDDWERYRRRPTSDDISGMLTLENTLVKTLNDLRKVYFEAKEARDYEAANEAWRTMVQLLPESWNQRRTIMLNYEVMANIYRSRRNHKLREWHDFIGFVKAGVPHPWIFTEGVA